MAQDRLQLTITADNSQSTQALNQTNNQMGSMEQIAARVANSIAGHFRQMATEIQRAIQGLGGVFNGLQTQAAQMRGLVDQYGHPISSGQVATSAGYASAGAVAGAARAGSASPELFRLKAEWEMWERRREAATGMSSRASADMMANRALASFTSQFEKEAGAADKASDAVKKHGDSMTGSMVKAAVLYTALSQGISLLKEATLGSAQYAARTEQLGVALHAVARAHGVNDEAIDRQVEKVKKLGVTTQDARQNLTRMLAARLDTSKAEEFARGAQDLGRISGEGTSVTMSRLTQAAIGGEVEMARSMGLSVNYENAYRAMEKELGRYRDGLSETEKRQARFNDLIRAMKEYAGAYSASMGSVGGAMISLQRYVDEAKNAIGERFSPALGTVVNWLTKLAKGTDESASKYAFWIKFILAATTAIIVYAGAMKAAAIATEALAVANAAAFKISPAMWIAGAVAAIAGLAATWLLARDKTDLATQSTNLSQEAFRKEKLEIENGNLKLEDRRKLLDDLEKRNKISDLATRRSNASQAMADADQALRQWESTPKQGQMAYASMAGAAPLQTEAQWQQAWQARKNDLDQKTAAFKALDAEYNKVAPVSPLINDPATAKNGISAEDQLSKQARAWMMAGFVEEAEGIAKVNAEYEKELASLREIAKEKKVAIPTGVMNDLDRGWAARATALGYEYNKKDAENAKELQKLTDEGRKHQREAETERLKGLDDWSKRNFDTFQEIRRQSEQFQASKIQKERDGLKEQESIEITHIEQMNARTLASRLGLEDLKLGVRLRYIEKEKELDIKLLEFKATVQKREFAITHAGQEDMIRQYSELIDAQTKFYTEDANDTAKEKAKLSQEQTIKAKGDIAVAQYKKVYDEIKKSSEGIFDAMLSKSESVWQAMANSFKNIFLTAFKEILSSQVARSLAGLFSGVGPNGQPQGNSGGILGRIRGILGGGTQAYGSDNSVHTPPFLPSGYAVAGMAAVGGGLVYAADGLPQKSGSINPLMFPGTGGLIKGKGGLASFLGQDGSGILGTGSAKGIFGSSGSFGKYGGAVQGGLLMAGTMLASDGWNRGGWGGAFEMGAGGASIGYSLGGPLGAGIGAAVGFGVGSLKALFGRSDITEMRNRVKSITGVQVFESSILKQWAAAAKGIGIDPWIRSRAGQEQIQMYADQTGQKFRSAFSVSQFNMGLSGGSIYEMASFTNGSVNSALSSLPIMGFGDMSSLSIGRLSSGTQNSTIQLDASATKDLLEGKAVQVIQSNPRLVAAAVTKAQSQDVGRWETITASNPSAIRG